MTETTGAPTVDAPWGFKANGQPYKRDPNIYAARSARASAGPRKPAAPRSTRSQQDRATAIQRALTVPVAVLAGIAQGAKSKPLLADAIVLGHSVPDLAGAVAEVAGQDDRIARIVDQLVDASPYAALFGALVPLAMQIGANHSARFAAAARQHGVVTAEEVIAAVHVPGPAPQPEAPQDDQGEHEAA